MSYFKSFSEIRKIVYTDSDPTSRPQTVKETKGEWNEKMRTNSLQLFRYSALTFNGHRVHYDQPYATQVEVYPGLVIHGPLLATWLSLFAVKKIWTHAQKIQFHRQTSGFRLTPFYSLRRKLRK
jgi:hydroxyacyl-ACP dehydratase HTD2-like protein with hotdog domain